MLLREGKVINIDSILDNNEKHWAINRFSLITFIISYTAFYDPNFKLYKSAVNDGSISIIKDKKLISNLEFIYINGPDRIERLYEKEMKLNDNIRQYIAMNYGDKFSSESEIINGLWSEETTKEFLVEAVKDGSFRFLLHGKLTMLKSKKLILDEQIIPRIQVVLEKYK